MKIRPIAEWNLEGQNTAAVRALPPEHIKRHACVFVAVRSHKDIAIHAAFLKNLGKHSIMAERVNIISNLRHNAKFFVKIPLAV